MIINKSTYKYVFFMIQNISWWRFISNTYFQLSLKNPYVLFGEAIRIYTTHRRFFKERY